MSGIAVAGIAVSVGMGFFSAESAKKQSKKQMTQLWNQETMKIASQEKLFLEQIQTENETQRMKIFSEGMLKYREALQKESTIRLRDTWIYVAGLGAGTSAIYAVSLMFYKSKTNG